MKYGEINCKTALSKSSLPGLDYSLNPYTGCEHACSYCYAPSTLHYGGTEPWGSFVQAKINIPVVLEKEARKFQPGTVGISTVTDPYQPLEKKLRLTRSCLEVLLAKNFPVCIQTKSALVLRDLDLISQFRKKEVGFTITTNDDRISRVLEPGATVASERLRAMRELSENGVPTWAFIGPIIPGIITEDNILETVEAIKAAGSSRILIDPLRLKPGLSEAMQAPLKELSGLTGRTCGVTCADTLWYHKVKEKIFRLCSEAGIACEQGL
ncbi:SPL family radical SAM protein [Methanocella sp. MCL-LM]|uniref:SPL family radical SAM protein n=1 Tax=Methanocella sp. MCL-LM TaxID=3412035 RepID=UPI003C785F96